jgi:5'-3' exonuclease
LREAQEFEGGKKGGNLHGTWRTLNITGLASVMIPSVNPNKVRDFVAAMSLLGNDFLPRSLTRTVRDDGIPKLLATLNEQVWAHNKPPLVGADGTIQRAGLAALVGSWAATEEGDMLAAAQEARRASIQPAGIGATPEETALREWNASPARWANLTRLLTPNHSTLIPGWRDVYNRTWHAGRPENYAAGVAWVWDYYSGRAIDQGWVHHEHLPPLWSDLHAALNAATGQTVSPPPIQHGTPLPAWVHLLSVLPAISVGRLLPANRWRAMEENPWYWPASWSLFDIGRTQMWECEPVIPVVPEGLLRTLK